ncbi:TPA: O-antigen ligase family protein [Streptococcus suis]
MLKFKKMDILAFIALLPIFEPTYFITIPLVSAIYNILGILLPIVIIAIAIRNKGTFKLFPSLLMGIELWILILTVFNRGQIRAAFSYFLMFTSVILLFSLYRTKMFSLFRALRLHFEICIYLNLLSLIFFPERLFSRFNVAYGFTFEWFLGSRNNFLIWLLPGLMIALMDSYYHPKSIRWKLLILAIFATQFYQTSSTLIVTSVMLIGLSFFAHINIFFKPISSLILALTMQFLIVIANNVSFLSPIIEGVLGKDLTFTNRTTIWVNALNNIHWIGLGKMQSEQLVNILGNFGLFLWRGATHAHNQLLNFGIQSGWIGLICIIAIYYRNSNKMNSLWKSPIVRILSFSMFVYIIAGVTEVTSHYLMQLMIIFPLYIEELIELRTEYNHRMGEIDEKDKSRSCK